MDLIRNRVLKPIVGALKSSATPEKIAFSLALGFAIGMFPIIGTSFILANFALFIGPFNPVVMNVANLVATPFCVLAIPAFSRLGSRLMLATEVSLSFEALQQGLKNNFMDTLKTFRVGILYAILGWTVSLPILTAVLYLVLLPVMRKASSMLQKKD